VVKTITAKVAANFVGVRATEKDEVLADKLTTADKMLKSLVAAGCFPGETSTEATTPTRIAYGSARQVLTPRRMARMTGRFPRY
jgi:hypothetical protein